MSHTPGPWHYYSGTPAVGSMESGRSICVVSGPRKRITLERKAERDANGTLLAAAPDLLAACQALIKYCSRRDGSLARYQEWMQAFIEDGSTITEAVERAADAIAKAEGR